MTKKEIQERFDFLKAYGEFDEWLRSLGFRSGHYWKERATFADINYWPEVEDLYSVEHYLHDDLKISIRFMRDRHKHIFYSIGEYQRSAGISMEDWKKFIWDKVQSEKKNLLEKLNSIPSPGGIS